MNRRVDQCTSRALAKLVKDAGTRVE